MSCRNLSKHHPVLVLVREVPVSVTTSVIGYINTTSNTQKTDGELNRLPPLHPADKTVVATCIVSCMFEIVA